MRLLLDTHVLLWALITPERLAPAIRDQLEDPANVVLFSAASIWEIAIKARLGRADFPQRPAAVSAAARRTGFTELAVHADAAARVAALPLLHRDPFDRMLVAQASIERLSIVTGDDQIGKYDVAVIW